MSEILPSSYSKLAQIAKPEGFAVPRPGPLVTGAGRTLSADDRLDLIEVISRFDLAYCALDQDLLFDVLTDDLIFEHPMGDAVGREGMLAIGVPSYGLRHEFLNPILFINPAGDPEVTCHMLVIQVLFRGDEEPVPFPHILDHNLLRYACRMIEGRWRISRMRFEQGRLSAYVEAPRAVYENFPLTAAERAAVRTPGS